MDRKEDYIAVFDSGVGGISVLRQLRRELPGERFFYFGDSANAPYGSRPTQEVRELTMAAVAHIFAARPCKALVIGCNTVTAAAISLLREVYPDKIIIGIEPALKVAADHFPGGTVGVMATEVTLREEKFDTLLHRFDGGCRVVKLPAPGAVELVESGRADSPEALALVQQLLGPWAGKLDALVLGCTHYPFLSGTIRRVLGPEVPLLDGGAGTARETRRRLAAAGLLENGPGELVLTNSREEPAIFDLSQMLLNLPL